MNLAPPRLVLSSSLCQLGYIYPLPSLRARQAGDKHLNREFKKKPRVTEVPIFYNVLHSHTGLLIPPRSMSV